MAGLAAFRAGSLERNSLSPLRPAVAEALAGELDADLAAARQRG